MRRYYFSISLLFATLAFTRQAVGDLTFHIEIAPSVQLEELRPVMLSDVATFRNLDAKSIAFIKIKMVGEFPSHSEPLILNNRQIGNLLRSLTSQIKTTDHRRLAIKIPDSLTVTRIPRDFTDENVRRVLQKAWQPLCAPCRVEFTDLNLPKIVANLKSSFWKIRGIEANQVPRGYFNVPVDFVAADSGEKTTQWVSGQLKIFKSVPVAERALYFGERLSAADVRIAERDVTTAVDSPPSQKEILGQRVRQPLRFGDIVWRSSIEREKALLRGESVKIKLGTGVWEVSAVAIAEQDGFIGDTVSVKNPRTQKKMVAVVTGKAEVMVP